MLLEREHVALPLLVRELGIHGPAVQVRQLAVGESRRRDPYEGDALRLDLPVRRGDEPDPEPTAQEDGRQRDAEDEHQVEAEERLEQRTDDVAADGGALPQGTHEAPGERADNRGRDGSEDRRPQAPVHAHPRERREEDEGDERVHRPVVEERHQHGSARLVGAEERQDAEEQADDRRYARGHESRGERPAEGSIRHPCARGTRRRWTVVRGCR